MYLLKGNNLQQQIDQNAFIFNEKMAIWREHEWQSTDIHFTEPIITEVIYK